MSSTEERCHRSTPSAQPTFERRHDVTSAGGAADGIFAPWRDRGRMVLPTIIVKGIGSDITGVDDRRALYSAGLPPFPLTQSKCSSHIVT